MRNTDGFVESLHLYKPLIRNLFGFRVRLRIQQRERIGDDLADFTESDGYAQAV
jgi:hypothetical protein